MAAGTYRARVIVLRKTKLGESDLVLTLLSEDGSQIRAVAKGARKPSSQFASRLELYSVADVLFAGGKSLDIIKEARLERAFGRIRSSMEHAAGAAAMAELLDRVEEAVAARLESLLAGDIPACPRDEDACTYCPVTVCSVRDALQRRSEGDE